jgi:hypothetical protein
VKLAGDPNNPVRLMSDSATADDCGEVMKHDAGVLDLEPLPASKRRIAQLIAAFFVGLCLSAAHRAIASVPNSVGVIGTRNCARSLLIASSPERGSTLLGAGSKGAGQE